MAGTSEEATYQQRVIDEEEALHQKFDKLEAFLVNDATKLPEEDRKLLLEQRGHMNGYLSVLQRRIERF